MTAQKYPEIIFKNLEPYIKGFSLESSLIVEVGAFGKVRLRQTVTVVGDVDLRGLGLKRLPTSFVHVTGDFLCDDNELDSLFGAPKYVGGDFSCSNNHLRSLEYSPKKVGRNYDCRNNRIVSIDPSYIDYIGGDFDGRYNSLDRHHLTEIEFLIKEFTRGRVKINPQ